MPRTTQLINHTVISYFYSPAVNAAQEFLALIPKLGEFGFGYSHTTVDVPPGRHTYEGSLVDIEVPERFQEATVNLKYSKQICSVKIEPQKRLITFNGIGVSNIAEQLKQLLVTAFPEPDSMPLTEERQSQLVELFEDLSALNAEYKTDVTARKAELVKVDKSQTDAFEKVHRAYIEQMGLKAPVKYWKDRNTAMTQKARTRLKWLCGAVALGGTGIALGFCGFDAYGMEQPPLWKFAFAAVALSLFVWILRMLATSYFSALHLAEDADFRAQVTESYLALLSEDAAGEGDRQFVLKELFRPVNYGLLKNEGPPLGLLDSIQKLVGK